MRATRHRNFVAYLFTEHPQSLGMSWAKHGGGAAKIGFELIATGAACLVHALIPGFFAETTSKTISRLNSEIHERGNSRARHAGGWR